MKKSAIIFFAVIVSVAIPFTVIAESRDLADKYQSEQSRGYWFYDDPVEETLPPPQTPVEPPPEEVVDLSPPKDLAKPPAPKPEEPVELTTEWLQANMKKYMYAAMDNPEDPEKVRAWLYMQRLMLDKSQRFSDATQRALITDPFLDENTRRPIASFGGAQSNRQAETIMGELYSRLSQRVGIWFFFRAEEMGMNNIQAGVLEMFERATGVTVHAISMDGSSLPNDQYPDAKRDIGQSKKLEIVQTPAMFLVNPSTNQIMPLGQAALALPDLKKRVLVAAASVDWVSEDDFQRTRGMRSELTLDSTPVINQSVLDDPQQVADQFQKILQKRAKDAL